MEYIQYETLGTIFEYSSANMNYYCFMGKGAEISREVLEDLKKEFRRLGSIEAVVDENNPLVLDIYYEVLEKICDFLRVWQVYSVDKTVLDKYCECCAEDFHNKFLDLYYDPYLEIVYGEKEAKEYRKARKQNRSRAVGYGYGIGGYVKASMKAGAVNMATGIGHSMVNSVGNMATKVGASIQKSTLYNDATRLESLLKACNNMVWSIIQKSMTVINNYTEIEIICPPIEKSDMAVALLNNLKEGKVPQEQNYSAICKIIELNPRLEEAYILALDTYGDQDGSLKDMAADFGIDLKRYVELKLENKYAVLLVTKYTDENEVLRLKDEITKLLEFYGLEKENQYISYLDNAWLEIDKNLRTVNDIEFTTREEANNYKEDIQLFQNFIQRQEFETLDLLDKQVVQQLVDRATGLEYKSKYIHEQIPYMVNIAVFPYVETQQVVNYIVEAESPVEAAQLVIKQNQSYSGISKRVSFSSLCNGKERKITQNIRCDEKILFIQDCSMMGTWSAAVIYTDKRIIIVNKKDIIAVSIEEVKSIKIQERAFVFITNDNQKIMSDILRGMDEGQYENWGKVISDITYGMKKVVPKNITVFCTQCGAKIPQNTNFCTFCGCINKYKG